MRAIATLIIGLALAGCTEKTPAPAAAPAVDYPAQKITDDVYVIHGPREYPNKTNKGFVNNPGFVVTEKGVVVIDPGSTTGVGEMVLGKIKAISDKPVVAVFNTHIHGDHWLGNEAIKKAYPKAIIYGHPNMIKLVEAGDGKTWVDLMNRLTEGTATPTKPVGPDLAVDNNEVVNIGGLQFRIHHTGHAHTKGDIMVEVVQRKVLFMGDIGSHMRILRMDDGHFKGNIAAIDYALASGVQFFVPGHGQSGGQEAAKGYRDYLSTLRSGVAKLYEQGMSDFEMKPKIEPDMNPWITWAGFTDEFGRHVSLCYLEIEKEAF